MIQPKPKLQQAEELIASGDPALIRRGVLELEKPEWANIPEAIELLGNGYAHQELYEKARNTFMKGFAITGDVHFKALHACAQLHIEADRAEGTKTIERLIAEDRVESHIYNTMIRHYLAWGQHRNALRLIEKVLARREWVAVHLRFEAMKALALAPSDEQAAKAITLEVLGRLFDRRFASFADVPDTYCEAIDTSLNTVYSINKKFRDLAGQFIDEESFVNGPTEDEMGFWDEVYEQEILPGVSLIEHTPASIAITMETFDELAPLRDSATSENL